MLFITFEKMTKDNLLDALILNVKNFFPDYCQICETEYHIKLGTLPSSHANVARKHINPVILTYLHQ